MDILQLSQWAVLIGAVVPVLVGVITRANASAAAKSTLLLTLELVNGVVTDWLATPNGFDWRGALVNVVAAWITGVATYYGLLRHTVSRVVNPATAQFGFGGHRAADHESRFNTAA